MADSITETPLILQDMKTPLVGTIATFDVEEPIVALLCRNLQVGTAAQTPFHITKMGEDVGKATKQIPNDLYFKLDIPFHYRVRVRHERIFYIFQLEGTHVELKQPCYVFVNIRGDRVDALLKRIAENAPTAVQDYATLVLSGLGTRINPADKNKIERDYLFGYGQVNVRLFPPLNQVT